MSLYLDIDLDYFTSPIIRESVTNHRPASDQATQMANPTELFDILRAKEIGLGPNRFIFTNHMQSHLRWWLAGKPANSVIHIDAHSDLYGHSHPDLSKLKMLGCQNYLWHSIREGLIAEIYWVFPNNIVDTSNPDTVCKMFSPSQVENVSVEGNILHLDLVCLLPGGTRKTVAYHILKAEDLPIFKETAEIITIATSPEFIPPQYDKLIQIVGNTLEIPQDLIDNILTKHQEMKIIK